MQPIVNKIKEIHCFLLSCFLKTILKNDTSHHNSKL
ncbi:hypothetical protein X975_09194, partial [Stegodyphus mimosarum]